MMETCIEFKSIVAWRSDWGQQHIHFNISRMLMRDSGKGT